jgi:hypothetical protein
MWFNTDYQENTHETIALPLADIHIGNKPVADLSTERFDRAHRPGPCADPNTRFSNYAHITDSPSTVPTIDIWILGYCRCDSHRRIADPVKKSLTITVA